MLDILALAVEQDQSFIDALEPYGKAPSSLLHFLSYALLPFSAVILSKHFQEASFARQCRQIVKSLEGGHSLSRALKKHAKHAFKRRELAAIATAERENHLAPTLRILANKPEPLKGAVGYWLSVAHFTLVAGVCGALGFMRSVDQYRHPDEDLSVVAELLIAAGKLVTFADIPSIPLTIFAWLLIAFCVATIIHFCIRRFFMGVVGRASAAHDAISSVSVALRDNCDIADALHWASQSCSHAHTRRSLAHCAEAIRRGQSWPASWREHCAADCGDEISNWILLSHPDLALGLARSADWLAERHLTLLRRSRLRLRLAANAICVIITASVVIEFFRYLSNLIHTAL